jgi:secondary thiamine-phosphate synthase enzyme
MTERTRRATKIPSGHTVTLAESPAARTEVLHFRSEARDEFYDLTDFVREVVTKAGTGHGQVTVYTPHTTTSIVINESETGFLNDFRAAIEALVPTDRYYEHDDHELRTENLQEDEFLNGHAHVRQLLTGSTTVTIPVVDGQVVLGRWQRVLFVELDQARERRVMVHAQGA